MNIGLRELRRQPGRFASVGVALTLLVVLLSVLGGFLDGLELSQTGPYRAHEGQLLGFSEQSDNIMQRSRIDETLVDEIVNTGDVAAVGSLNQIDSTANIAGGEIVDIVLFGYDLATATIPAPPSNGAVVDAALAEQNNLEVGDTLLVGATSEPVPIAALVSDLTQASPTVWLATDRWRQIVEASNPAALLPLGISQAVVIEPASEVEAADLQNQLATIDGLSAVTAAEAVESLPAVQQQSSTFRGIIGMTYVVTLLVVALFFALLTLERQGLYAVLKALGAGTRDLMTGISAQALCVSVLATLAGFLLSLGFVTLLPADLPVRLLPARLAQIGLGVIVTALVGSLFSLRRVIAIDPAEAIG